MTDAEIRTRSIDTIRALAMDAVQKANAGHPGTAMALAPLAYLIFTKHLRHNPTNPDWPNRDRFVLSAGHAAILQYSLLHLTGYNLSLEELKRFRQWESKTPGHPEHFMTPGIETTTGPLGQGFANGVGMAFAERFLAERYNRPYHEIVDHCVYAICSDGDLMEGVSYEASSLAGHNGLGKLIYVYDDNHITIDGTTSISFSEDRGKRFEAQDWHVQHVEDSEDIDAIDAALTAAREEKERPSIVILRSHIAYPAPKAVDTSKAHGAPLGDEEVRATKRVMGFDPDKTFDVDPAVYEHMSQVERGVRLEQEWRDAFERWSTAFPELREDWDQVHTGKMRPGWTPPEFEPGEELATRQAGKIVMQSFKQFTPTMIGGAADLVESTYTEFEGGGVFSRMHAGRNIAFGIREHAMGSIVNGISVHGGMLKPYGSTFLIFSDYMRPAVRLSALMGTAGGLGLDARLGRARRGRADTPARGALHGAARDPELLVRAAGRRERDVVGLEGRARARRRPGRALALATEGADARPLGSRAGVGSRAGRLHAVGFARGGTGRARSDPDRVGRRGGAGARGGAQDRR